MPFTRFFKTVMNNSELLFLLGLGFAMVYHINKEFEEYDAQGMEPTPYIALGSTFFLMKLVAKIIERSAFVRALENRDNAQLVERTSSLLRPK